MSDINSNFNNFSFNLNRAEQGREKPPSKSADIEAHKSAPEQHIVSDTGVIGRSQVYGAKGGNIEKSADEAAEMVKNQPIRLRCSEKIYDTLYNQFLNEGYDEKTAAKYALIGEEEFLTISSGLSR